MSNINLEEFKGKEIEFNNTNFMYLEWFLKKELVFGRPQKIQKVNADNLFIKIRIRKDKENKDLIVGGGFAGITNLIVETSETKGFLKEMNGILENKQIMNILQLNLEKLILFIFQDYKLYFEFFSSNNIILTDGSDKIVLCLYKEKWKDRTIARGEKYIPPTNVKNVLSYVPKEDDINSKKNMVSNIVKNCNISPILIEKYLESEKNDKNVFDFKTYKKVVVGIKKIFSLLFYEKTKIIILEKKVTFYNLNLPFLQEINYNLNQIYEELILKPEFLQSKNKNKKDFEKEKQNIEYTLNQQKGAKEKLNEKTAKYKIIGDCIYQNFDYLNQIKIIVKNGLEEKKNIESIEKEIKDFEKGRKIKLKKIEKEKQKIVFLIE